MPKEFIPMPDRLAPIATTAPGADAQAHRTLSQRRDTPLSSGLRRMPVGSMLAFLLTVVCWSVCAADAERTEVELRETADGRWLVEFSFPEPQRAVVFTQAPEPYRGGAWVSQTDGVEVETVGAVDVMVFAEPGTSARFEIEPHTTSLRKAYTPFLAFTDGGWGVLEGQFRMSPAESREAVEAFDGNGESWEGEQLAYSLSIASPKPIFHGGEWADGALELVPEGDGTYAYVGDAAVQQGENYVGFVDQGLPAWIQDALDDDLAVIFEELSEEWGLTLPERVEILFVYDGADRPGLQATGGAIGSQLSLQVSGEDLLEPDASIMDYFRWFLTHEAAHVFQYAAGMRGFPSADAWMHEGVANTMAHRIGGRIALDGEAFLGEVYGRAFSTCVTYLESGAPLVAAIETGRFDAYYACGDLIGLVTEAWLDDGDIFDFWRAFLAESQARGDNEISAELYFELAGKKGLADSQVERLQAFVREPVSEPGKTLTALLSDAALTPSFSEEGALESLALPE